MCSVEFRRRIIHRESGVNGLPRAGRTEFERRSHDFRIIAEAREPVDCRLFAEPGHLALRKSSSGLLNLLNRLFPSQPPCEVRPQFRVADKLKSFCVGRDAARDQPADFLDPTREDHRFDARMNPFIKRRARGEKPDLPDFVPYEAAPARAMNLANRRACEKPDLNRANDFLPIAGSNPRGRLRVEPHQNAMEMLRFFPLGFCAQALSQPFGPSWCIGQTLEQRAQIQSGARGENRKLAAAANVFENFPSAPRIIAGREDILRLDDIHKMMGNTLLLASRDFRGADVEMAVDLRGIADENFAAHPLSELNPER